MRKLVEEEKKKGGDAGEYKKLMQLLMQLRKWCVPLSLSLAPSSLRVPG